MNRSEKSDVALWSPLPVVGILLMSLLSSAAEADQHQLEIEILGSSPRSLQVDDPTRFAMVVGSGWPLTVYVKPGMDFAGYGHPAPFPYFPTVETTYPWVFGVEPYGPDGCPSWSDSQAVFDDPNTPGPDPHGEFPDCYTDGSPPNDPWPIDELIMPFTPGVTVPEDCPQFCPVDDPLCCEGYLQMPEVDWSDPTAPPRDANVGPFLGTPDDGYSIGASPRFPGLVVTADSGIGLELETSPPFDRTGQCRNLAGLFQSVSYVLSDRWYDSAVVAHMNVPAGTFTPVAHVDAGFNNYCSDEHPSSDSWLKIDGHPAGEPECREGALSYLLNLVRDRLVTVRAFVVLVDENGEGPDAIEDWDSDGDCDADDAANMGLRLMSEEAVFRFSLYLEVERALRWDWDADGEVGGDVAPAGSGGVRQPPR